MDPVLEYLKQHLTAAQLEEFLLLAGNQPSQWSIPLPPRKKKLYITEERLKAQQEAWDALANTPSSLDMDPLEYQRQMRKEREYR